MSHPNHSHDHGCCSHQAGGIPDDEHVKPGEGTQDFLYSKIDRDQITSCNLDPENPAKNCIKPWSDRMDDTMFSESDTDQQMIIRIPFTGSVKLRSILIRGIPGDSAPTQLKLFANEPGLDFDTLETCTPTQVLEIPTTDELVEFPVRVAKFSSVSVLSLFIDGNPSGSKTRVYFLGFKGEFSALSRKPVIAIYEAQANPTDHEKISGMDTQMGRMI
ncbi:uncharacterized protein MELLADRAFT_93329 [Melampsora larici-populina 98AG31]|uniref:PITH domain-containing protein n=1 Tax=Melampsora larici-populina (strain 98AG31 / pathotype 3-4-7) TaxID=747676 RepID=F4S4T1_MELLP|nr:uncharacterized protein MELLADRAFT_93329 [Melampsora larici-populina 98AG31]EGG00373.1 hypothetical protein MELLADRAFT_93329 [Melampsora larici-populina 98AG31]